MESRYDIRYIGSVESTGATWSTAYLIDKNVPDAKEFWLLSAGGYTQALAHAALVVLLREHIQNLQLLLQ
jgi:hypothetical protein